jgi:hypothetical protein
MKSLVELEERIKILEQGLQLTGEEAQAREETLRREVRDLHMQIRALQLYLARRDSEFKKQYAELVKKAKT